MLQKRVDFTSGGLTTGRRCCSVVAQPCRSRSSRLVVQAYQKLQKRLKYSKSGSKRGEPLVVTVEPDGSDAWRLDQIVDMLKDGAVGVIPTDTLPAIVADVHNRDAVLRLYTIKEMDAKKPLSLLCNSFTCISTYTTGFPSSNTPGQPNWFNMARRILPGPVSLTTRLQTDTRHSWNLLVAVLCPLANPSPPGILSKTHIAHPMLLTLTTCSSFPFTSAVHVRAASHQEPALPVHRLHVWEDHPPQERGRQAQRGPSVPGELLGGTYCLLTMLPCTALFVQPSPMY